MTKTSILPAFASSLLLVSFASGASAMAGTTSPFYVGAPLTSIVPQGSAGRGLCHVTAPTSGLSQFYAPSAPRGTLAASIQSYVSSRPVGTTYGPVSVPALDFTNHNLAGVQSSLGDFTANQIPGCTPEGCLFPGAVNGASNSWASVYSGYLAVPAAWVGRVVHLGLYVDDAAYVRICGASGCQLVAERPLQLGSSTWRLTTPLVFSGEGLYSLEVGHLEGAEHAALEVSHLLGSFADFERPALQSPVTPLDDAGFTLLPDSLLYQSVDGTGDCN